MRTYICGITIMHCLLFVQTNIQFDKKNPLWLSWAMMVFLPFLASKLLIYVLGCPLVVCEIRCPGCFGVFLKY